MRRDKWMLLAALLAAGCAAEDQGQAVEQARSRLTAPAAAAPALQGAPEVRRHLDAPAAAPKPAAGQAVDPQAGTPPAADPAPAADPIPTAPPAPVLPPPVQAAPALDPATAIEHGENSAVLQAPPSGLAPLPAPDVQIMPLPSNLPPPPKDVGMNPEVPPEVQDVVPLKADQQFALDFPWGKGAHGDWQGTGSPDPEPIRNISSPEMVKRAMDTNPSHRGDRYTAMVSCARRHLPQAISIIQSALSDDYEFTRQIAVSALIEHGGPSALPLMWQALKDPAPKVRGSAIWAIALYGEDEALKAIQAGLSDADPGVQGMAILATTSLQDLDKVWPILEGAAQSDQQRVYQEAAYVLSSIESRKSMEMLAKTLRESKDGQKQQTFAFYLRALRRKAPQLLLPQPQR